MRRLPAILALVSTCGPTAPAIASDQAHAPQPELVCRERYAPDVPAADCAASRGVVQPCSGVLVPRSTILRAARTASDLKACRELADIAAHECAALRDSDGRGCSDREAALVAERDSARELAAANAAELERLRANVVEGPAWYASPWLWGAVGVIVGAVVVTVAR